MPRARDEVEQLRGGVEEVGDLGDQEEEERFAEVAEDTNDGKDHACKVAVSVPNEDFGGVPVVAPQGEGDAEEGKQEVDGEEMGVSGRATGRSGGVVE